MMSISTEKARSFSFGPYSMVSKAGELAADLGDHGYMHQGLGLRVKFYMPPTQFFEL